MGAEEKTISVSLVSRVIGMYMSMRGGARGGLKGRCFFSFEAQGWGAELDGASRSDEIFLPNEE